MTTFDPYRVYTLREVALLLRVRYEVVRDAVFADRWPHVKISPRKRVMTQENVDATIRLLHQPVVEASSPTARADKRRQLRDSFRNAA